MGRGVSPTDKCGIVRKSGRYRGIVRYWEHQSVWYGGWCKKKGLPAGSRQPQCLLLGRREFVANSDAFTHPVQYLIFDPAYSRGAKTNPHGKLPVRFQAGNVRR